MQTFPIRTYTVVKTETQSILHSPALPRPGVPYDDSAGGTSGASRLVIVAYRDGDPGLSPTLVGGELRIVTTFEAFDRLEQLLLDAPKTTQGRKFPFSTLDAPPGVDFVADNQTVISYALPS